mmetsp:Transcript_20645/g.24803  ORF Transcript_20645/g.24803 Transcript_20645/m.24803 type:complete len:114 (+) Transcript_20645:212-553(+)|eukprot:CAMPEP_0197848996 /NCGR_PEP_ID=MMETSP1438-20131217/10583_1 /TAXON_ID=1461541 /ORGANISM="Pterosperma sp., Strain CCMP1384" /LENGTH=113 /DNA_ID=CAMNT_0043461487 /DNA_START=212 /DNA_END=553 /DNA_ORIENTATION=-
MGNTLPAMLKDDTLNQTDPIFDTPEQNLAKQSVPRLEKELGECCDNQLDYCFYLGSALALPIGIKRKTVFPIIAGGLGGSALDFFKTFFFTCNGERERLQAAIAVARGPPATS